MKQSLPVSTKLLIAIPMVLLAIWIAVICINMSGGNAPVIARDLSTAPSGSIIVIVKDGYSDQPLADSTVVIPETSQSIKTGIDGKTPPIKVPILEDSKFSGILPKTWGEITLLVYKQGYVDCAIFHVNIWENQTRNGPTVLLFPADGNNTQPFTLTEGPGRIWVNQLLDQFRPHADSQ